MSGTVTVNLPADVAEALLLARAWRREHGTGGGWLSPAGAHHWRTAAALTAALMLESTGEGVGRS